MNKEELILETIKSCFAFLCDGYDAKIVKEDVDVGMRSVFVTYVTAHAGVSVSYEAMEGGIYAMIFPLQDDKIPPYQYWYDVLDYFRVSGVDFAEVEVTDWGNPDIGEVRDAFENFAVNMQDHVGPFLEGDFSSGPLMDQIVHQRMESKGRIQGE